VSVTGTFLPWYFSHNGDKLYTFPRKDTQRSSTVLWIATSLGVKYFGRDILTKTNFSDVVNVNTGSRGLINAFNRFSVLNEMYFGNYLK